MRSFRKLYGVSQRQTRHRSFVLAALLAAVVPVIAAAPAQAAPDPQGTIYVADYEANQIDVFAPGATGNVAPLRTIGGASSGINGPADVAVDANGDVYSSNFNSSTITEYAPGASGNATPIRTIGGSATGLSQNDDISLAPDGTLYVGNFGGPITIYAPGATGNAAPVRMITTLTGVDGLGVDATGTLYADTSGGVDVFAPGANGAATPIRTITGPSTNLSAPDDVKVGFGGQLFVSDGNNSVEAFAPGASGNATPTQSISGSATNLTEVDDLAVDPTGMVYVTNFGASGVVAFAPGATGNATPAAVISGSNTTLAEPEGVALAEPVSGASMTTQVQSSSISLGATTQDSATLSGGSSPTGAIVFNLYGPNDAQCTGAPAFTSSPIPVTGNATYPSPAFMPTAAGTYSWVAEYSGDASNPPITTACTDPAESVTVGGTATDPPINASYNGPTRSGVSLCDGFATFTDPDPTAQASDYSASIDWGDGTSSAATIILGAKGQFFEVRGCHTYAGAGSYSASIQITDVDNFSNTTSQDITITMTGGGSSGAPTVGATSHGSTQATQGATRTTAHHTARHRARHHARARHARRAAHRR